MKLNLEAVMLDQTQLILEAQQGDVEAFEELVARNYAYAKKICSDRFRSFPAEDIMQEAFLRIWNSLKQLKDPERFRPWLRSTLVNTGNDCIRREMSTRRCRPYGKAISADGDDLESMMALKSIAEHQDREEALRVRDIVDIALNALSEREQNILRGYYLEGLSMAELAKQYEMSVSHVKVCSHRGRVKARAALDGLIL